MNKKKEWKVFSIPLFFITFFLFFPEIITAESTFLRAPIWVYGEAFPGESTEKNISSEQKLPPSKEMEELAIYIVSGMIYGWKFTYTPSDTKRNVAEFFELIPIATIDPLDSHFSLVDIQAQYPRLTCWAQYTHNDLSLFHTKRWDTILAKSSYGRGRGERSEDFTGVKKAYTAAFLQSIREYARSIEKNKPKEILGEILLREAPRLFVDEGFFVAETRVSLKITEIIPYRVF